MYPFIPNALIRYDDFLQQINLKRSYGVVCDGTKIEGFSRAKILSMCHKVRSQLIEIIKRKGTSGHIYSIHLTPIVFLIPQSQIYLHIESLMSFLKKSHEKQIKLEPSFKQLKEYLFPFKMEKWIRVMDSQNKASLSVQLNVKLLNIYTLKFSKNVTLLYEDLKDFDKMIEKFNFYRFFTEMRPKNCRNRQKVNLKALIKVLQWKTDETERYLLLLIDIYDWQMNQIIWKKLIELYEFENACPLKNETVIECKR